MSNCQSISKPYGPVVRPSEEFFSSTSITPNHIQTFQLRGIPGYVLYLEFSYKFLELKFDFVLRSIRSTLKLTI